MARVAQPAAQGSAPEVDPPPPPPRAVLLRARFADAPDVAAASSLTCDLLVDLGLTMPSLYLARGGRLRCTAVRGYWQAFDGMPPGAGVIGAVYATGEPRELRGVAGDPAYLAAAVSVLDEICVPVRHRGQVVGALNVESTDRLRPDALTIVLAVAQAFEHRLAQLGGPPPESPAQRLGRHAALLQACTTRGEVVRSALAAAADLAGMSTALLALPDAGGRLAVVGASGPLAGALSDVAGLLTGVADWVSSGTSVYSMDNPAGHLFDGSHQLRAAGAAAIVVLPVTSADGGQGVLLVADGEPSQPSTDTVEVLELLSGQVTPCLRTAVLLNQLRERAARDPLTGLGHQGTFAETLRGVLATAEGMPTALLMLDLDGFKSVNDQQGHLAGDQLLLRVSRAMSAVLREDDLHRVGGDEFAALVRVPDLAEARAVGDRLRRSVAETHDAVTLSVGIAVARPLEAPDELIARADAALYLAKANGRDRVEVASAPAYDSLGE